MIFIASAYLSTLSSIQRLLCILSLCISFDIDERLDHQMDILCVFNTNNFDVDVYNFINRCHSKSSLYSLPSRFRVESLLKISFLDIGW